MICYIFIVYQVFVLSIIFQSKKSDVIVSVKGLDIECKTLFGPLNKWSKGLSHVGTYDLYNKVPDGFDC